MFFVYRLEHFDKVMGNLRHIGLYDITGIQKLMIWMDNDSNLNDLEI